MTEPKQCEHLASIKGTDGLWRCLSCGDALEEKNRHRAIVDIADDKEGRPASWRVRIVEKG